MANLAEFMNDQLGAFPGPLLRESGPSSLQLYRAARNAQLTESVLASLFWWCFVRTGDFQHDVLDYVPSLRGEARTGPSPRREIIVSHAQGGRHDLLILAADAREPFTIHGVSGAGVFPGAQQGIIRPGLAEVALDQAPRLHGRLTRAGINVDVRTVPLAITEVGREGTFGIVIAAEPQETPTGITRSDTAGPVVRSFVAPTPALPVCRPGEQIPLATAGVIGTGQDGRVLAITARHPVTDEPHFLVAGSTATINHEDVLTDTCLLALTCPAGTWPGTGRAGPLKITPALHQPATFHGATSGHRQTVIHSFDLSVVDPSPLLSSKIYTDADTMPGDSGTALIDSGDHIAGFAVSRTSYDSRVAFSSWSWADQVLTHHGLT